MSSRLPVHKKAFTWTILFLVLWVASCTTTSLGPGSAVPAAAAGGLSSATDQSLIAPPYGGTYSIPTDARFVLSHDFLGSFRNLIVHVPGEPSDADKN